MLQRSTRPLFTPRTKFERKGFVPDVVFPTGIIVEDRTLRVYYGAGDTSSTVVHWSLNDILTSLSSSSILSFP